MTDSEDLPGCVRDVTSVDGLRRLVREQPTRWHIALRKQAPGMPEDLADATVGQVLRGGLWGELVPRHRGDAERLRRERGGARRLVALVGAAAMADVDEAVLADVRGRLIAGDEASGRAALSAEVATRTVSLLRKAAYRWGTEVGRTPAVAERASASSRPARRRPPRKTMSLADLRRLLHAAWPEERAVLALALGGGLREGEIAALRRRDLQVKAPKRRGRRATVEPSSIEVVLDITTPSDSYGMRGRLRIAPLPLWACELVGAPEAGLPSKAPDALLFPHRSDPDRPRSSFRSMMDRLRTRALGPHGPRCSLADLRRCWQRVAREALAPREVVRQTWWIETPAPGIEPRSHALQSVRALAGHWATLGAPIAGVLTNPAVLPRRAPKGCGPGEPEKQDPWKGWRPLPPSCG